MSVSKPTLNSLINSFRQQISGDSKDYVLWQILVALSNANETLRTDYNKLKSAFNWTMRLEIPTPEIDTDVLETAHRVFLPRDGSNNIVYSSVKPHFVGITAKVPPTGHLVADILYSRDGGTNRSSIFQSNTTLNLDVGIQFGRFAIFSLGNLFDGDLISMDVSDDGGASGIEVLIVGDYVA